MNWLDSVSLFCRKSYPSLWLNDAVPRSFTHPTSRRSLGSNSAKYTSTQWRFWLQLWYVHPLTRGKFYFWCRLIHTRLEIHTTIWLIVNSFDPYSVKPHVSDHPKCKELVFAQGRWSLIAKSQTARGEVRIHLVFGENVLHAIFRLQYM